MFICILLFSCIVCFANCISRHSDARGLLAEEWGDLGEGKQSKQEEIAPLSLKIGSLSTYPVHEIGRIQRIKI